MMRMISRGSVVLRGVMVLEGGRGRQEDTSVVQMGRLEESNETVMVRI